MITRLLSSFFFLIAAASGSAKLPQDQLHSIFNQANDSFRQANSAGNDTDKANSLYEKAVLGYEKIIHEGNVKNPKLYCNLANAYLLKGDIGNAILNYRRAENLDKSNSEIEKNLTFARSRRMDKIEIKTEKQVLQTLLFWHYGLSMKAKFILSFICFAVFCFSLAYMIWFGRRTSLTFITCIAAILFLCFIGSLSIEQYSRTVNLSGVIIADQVAAYQGDGTNYPTSFKAPLHTGTEFDLMERRPGWFHIKLADGSDGWIVQNTAEII